MDKMKKGLRAFDELKTIDMPEPTDTTSGGGGGGGVGDGATSGEGLVGKWNPGAAQ